jgi:hypothetical protein
MSTVNNGPQIVRNGLVLDLDASYMRSYSPNVFPNPTDLLGWSQMTGVIQSCTVTRDTSMTRQYGSIPLKMTVTGNDSFTGGYGYLAANLASALSGQTWTISIWAKASVATDGQLFIFGADTNGAVFTINDYSAGTIAITTSWQRFSFSYTFTNASTRYIQFRLDGTNSGGSGITIWWDGLQVERASAATTFNPYYFGDTVWKDVSGNGRNGTLTSGPTFDVSNKGSILFNGSSQYVNVSSLITGNQSFSWGAWIYPTATGTPVFFGNVSTGLAMLSYWDSANNKVRVGTYGVDRLTSGTAILPSTWGYTFWTWDGTTLTSYTNGIADGTATGFSFNISNLYTTIGNSVNAQYFAGRIAQTLVYNRVLSAAEVSQNFQATKTRFGL